MFLAKQKLNSNIRCSSDNKFGYRTFFCQLKTIKEISQAQGLERIEMLDTDICAFKSNNLKDDTLGELKC